MFLIYRFLRLFPLLFTLVSLAGGFLPVDSGSARINFNEGKEPSFCIENT
jgi:hypothetical protein